mmetsp:Transcript_68397/g.150370  ORF Transcript_68397/g.150370 Transcript_68397/m.150370 type:complete len:268 (+) Transcript_68397:213-1016(+)
MPAACVPGADRILKKTLGDHLIARAKATAKEKTKDGARVGEILGMTVVTTMMTWMAMAMATRAKDGRAKTVVRARMAARDMVDTMVDTAVDMVDMARARARARATALIAAPDTQATPCTMSVVMIAALIVRGRRVVEVLVVLEADGSMTCSETRATAWMSSGTLVAVAQPEKAKARARAARARPRMESQLTPNSLTRNSASILARRQMALKRSILMESWSHTWAKGRKKPPRRQRRQKRQMPRKSQQRLPRSEARPAKVTRFIWSWP